eukprot:TRINITY_DN19120_c0_g1_i1.p1 TRINITY_DN19120_c0_g1~~TRINITY_DN19120_c0_g1_i1.p1  ORF type:complete len:209 (+),score=24.93 TRINITY_DN19120_c0_g1_i1:73-699(+)
MCIRDSPGTLWGQLVRYLNTFGLSPMTMQSYCTFSVGGTCAVNAHGITNDRTMIESVCSVRCVMPDGTTRTVFPHEELFGLLIGGYGLFGIITELTLKVRANVKLGMEMVQLSVEEFSSYYQQFLDNEDGNGDPTLEVKIARINVISGDSISLFLFRRHLPSISNVLVRTSSRGQDGPLEIASSRRSQDVSLEAVSYTHLTLPTKRIV